MMLCAINVSLFIFQPKRSTANVEDTHIVLFKVDMVNFGELIRAFMLVANYNNVKKLNLNLNLNFKLNLKYRCIKCDTLS